MIPISNMILFQTDAVIHSLKTENAHLTTQLTLLSQERQEQVKNYENCVLQIQTLQEELRATTEYVKDMEVNGFIFVVCRL